MANGRCDLLANALSMGCVAISPGHPTHSAVRTFVAPLVWISTKVGIMGES